MFVKKNGAKRWRWVLAGRRVFGSGGSISCATPCYSYKPPMCAGQATLSASPNTSPSGLCSPSHFWQFHLPPSWIYIWTRILDFWNLLFTGWEYGGRGGEGRKSLWATNQGVPSRTIFFKGEKSKVRRKVPSWKCSVLCVTTLLILRDRHLILDIFG